MIETEGELSGRRVTRDAPFPFRCHRGLACFNSCCRDKRLALLPYDVLRLSRALGLDSATFLAEHAALELEPGSGWPIVRVALRDDGRCPFVRPEGCGVYPDRPTCCRIYPLARAVGLGRDGAPLEVLLVDATEDRCGGFGAPGAGTVQEWTVGQGLEAYRGPNERAARLFLHPRRPHPLALPSADVHAVVMALYNPDVFRRFASRPGFASESGLGAARVEEGLRGDEDLLALGQDWIAARLFG
ncbi:MAG TPA: YkgJ family cysteine cluster protein [Anaeromyxobacter sp.]|nr:YkgJ family cysteine cluster protein [Anaeromyxobacter sp.]